MKKQHFKRIYGIILGLLSLTANAAAYDFEADGMYYNIISVTEFTARVAGVADSTLTDIAIPETVTYNNRELTVIEIEESAFKDYEALESVSIPNTLTSISDNAFYSCSSLAEVKLPEGLTAIGSHAFAGCTSLKAITLPESLKSLGGGAFYGSGIQSIRIPNKITTIQAFYYSGCFENCEQLEEVILPEGLTTIGSRAFTGCTSLKEISLPESLQTIGNYAFEESGLQSIRIPNGITSIPLCCFKDCEQLEEAILPEGLKTIGYQAFKNCTSLKEISLPESLQTIGEEAFASSGLVSFDTKRVTDLAYNALDGCDDLEEIVFGGGFKRFNYFSSLYSSESEYEYRYMIENPLEKNYQSSDDNNYYLKPKLPNLKRIIFLDEFYLYGTTNYIDRSNLGWWDDDKDSPVATIYALGTYDNIEYFYAGGPLKGTDIFLYEEVSGLNKLEMYFGSEEGRTTIHWYVKGSGWYWTYLSPEVETTIQTLEIGGTCTEVPLMHQKIENLMLGSNITEFDTDSIQIDELKSIACYAATPPTLYNYDNIPATVYTDATVYVPAGSIEAYQAADGWRGFWNIQEAPAVFLNLSAADTTLMQGETFQLKSRIVPRAAIDKPVAWSSSDEDVATVSETGLVTALETGTAIITATCEGVTATCEVKVMDNTGIEEILPDRNAKYTVYNLQGILVRRGCTLGELQDLPKGIYILTNGKERFKVAN